MKTTWKRASIAAVVGLLIAAGGAPAKAGCPGSQLLDATFHYLVSNPNWCGSFGCYDSQSGPPISQNMKAVYWDVGTANPAIGLGNDSGLFSGGFAPGNFWIKQLDVDFGGNTYHYPGFISLKLGPPNVVGPPVTWSSPDADGCGPGGNPPAIRCTCMMITDVWNGVGYFATLSAQSDALGNTQFLRGGDYHLQPIPPALITGSVRDTASGDVCVSVTLGGAISGAPDEPGEGVYAKDGCGSCLQGFQIFGAIVPRGGSPSASQFAVLPRCDGTQQGVVGFGGQVSVRADGNPAAEQDLFLTSGIVGEGPTPFTTFGQGSFSAKSTRVPLGSNMATPGSRDRGGRGEDSRRSRTTR